MKKQILTLLAVVALCLGLLSVSALAVDEPCNLWVNGVAVTSENADDVLGNADGEGATVAYDANTNTLTLNGATLSGYYEDYAYPVFIYAENDLNIVLIGDNKVEYGDNDEYPRAIYVSGDLNISGNGSLTCGSENNAFAGFGIECSGNLKVENATLNFYVENDGIYCWNGDVELNSANINIESKSENSNCIFGNNITITGGEVKLVSNGEKQYDSYGIYGDIIVEICDAKVEIKAYYCGIYSSEALKVTGKNTSLSVSLMDNSDADRKAVYAPYISVNDAIYPGELKELVVKDGSVNKAAALNAPTKVYVNGVDIKSDSVPGASYDDDTNTLTLNGANLSTGHVYGSGVGAVIYANGDLNIVLEGENTVTASDGSINYFDGINIGGALTLSGGGSLTVISNNSIAIDVDDNTCIASGKLIAAGYTEGIDIGDDLYVLEGVEIEATSTTDYGIETGDDLIVYGGSIDATGYDKGIYIDGNLTIEGGSVSATATADNGAALYFEGDERVLTIGETAALTLNAATPVEVEEGDDPYTLENNGKLTVHVDSVEEIDQFLDAGGTLGFVLRQDITGTVTIPAGADVTISGVDEYTLTGRINCTVAADNTKTTKLTLDDLTLDGGGTQKMAVISQDQESKTVSGLELSMTGCTVQYYTDKAVYLTNATALNIDDCTFTDNATGDMDKPNTKGDYTIDLNLVSVKAGELSITNSSFSGTCGDKAVIKVAARGGDSDADASDISGSAATVKKLTISGCTFSDSPAATADVNIGTDSKKVWTDDSKNTFTNNTTGNFAVTISNNETAVVVNPAYQTYKGTDGNYYIASGNGTEEVKNITVPKGVTAEKAAGGDMTIESTGTTTPTEPEEPEEDNWPFMDVAEDAWYYEAVKYVYENGLMIGTADDTFAPNSTLSRAMVAQILYNLEGQPTADGESTFTDASGHWAANAIAWAQETGVVSGYENNTFRPNRAVTREELAQMLYNYAQYKDYDLTATGDLSQFSDGDKVQDWAEEAVSWANGNGLINGHDDGTLEPGGNATRAQAASILMNFDLNLVEE